MSRLNTRDMTWAALLGKWVEYAQAALSLPNDAEGERWRRSVPPVINLQAVTFALGELEQLPCAERALARDKADLIIERCADELDDIWANAVELPPMLEELVEDADRALNNAQWIGLMELIYRGDEPRCMPNVDVDELIEQIDPDGRGSLALAQPGTYIMPGEPFLWWCDMDRADDTLISLLPESQPTSSPKPRQIIRQMSDGGEILRDVIVWLDDEDIDGLPLLVPIMVQGERIGRFTLDADAWAEAQQRTLTDRMIEVVDRTAAETETDSPPDP